MENNQARTLAYTLAKELDHKDLGEVVGGGRGHHLCRELTHFATNKTTVDASPDLTVDI